MCFNKKEETKIKQLPKPEFKVGSYKINKYWDIEVADYRYGLFQYIKWDEEYIWDYIFGHKDLSWAQRTAKHFDIEIQE